MANLELCRNLGLDFWVNWETANVYEIDVDRIPGIWLKQSEEYVDQLFVLLKRNLFLRLTTYFGFLCLESLLLKHYQQTFIESPALCKDKW